MLKTRVIPVLLLQKNGLVKSVRFRKHRYVGDPINAVKIFNEKEVDELLIIDIDASRENREPDFSLISDISREAYMPFGYGGGISKLDTIRKLMHLGVEKVCINQHALRQPGFLRAAAELCGSQSVVASIDVKKDLWGNYHVYDYLNEKKTNISPWDYAARMEHEGAGEIVLNAVDRDGTFLGYDNELIKKVSPAVTIPVIALGGAGNIQHFPEAVKSGASAVAAGSFFIFYGPHRAVLITYPDKAELKQLFS